MSHLPATLKILPLGLIILLASCGNTAKTTTAEKKPLPAEQAAPAAKPTPKAFASPSEAGAALLSAAQSGDPAAWVEIFGPEGTEILFTGDAARDSANLRDFVVAYTRMNRWGAIKAGGQTLYIGPGNYAFPIPLGQDASGRWAFDTAAGKDEILARRIGRHELAAIAACEAAAKAKKQPAGLADLGEFGKTVASAAPGQPPLFNGYYYRILNNAPGNFIVLAYPAEYRNSGLMSFFAGKDGVVYQKDLGESTADTAAAMSGVKVADGWNPAMPHTGSASRLK